MARRRREVVPGLAHHVTQRGSRRLPTFFRDADYELYLALLHQNLKRYEVELWTYSLMPNHVHLIVAPPDETSMSRCIAVTHQSYAYRKNRELGWVGHFWQERFFSCPLDEKHLYNAARYVLMNPVRAGLVRHAKWWSFSSARLHLGLEGRNGMVKASRLSAVVADWQQLLSRDLGEDQKRILRLCTQRGVEYCGVDPTEERSSDRELKTRAASALRAPVRQRKR